MANVHLHEELASNSDRVTVETKFGKVTGGRALNGAVVFLEIPYALPPLRFADPVALPEDYHAFQPTNDGQAGVVEVLGMLTELASRLFANIIGPPSFPSKIGLPVKVYLHGGFLQFGSPHGLKSQKQFVAAEKEEVHVNIGYRLSAFGFLACDEPKVAGNFGFKDQWMGLEWIRDNIAAFGGNPENITIQGLSAGAHSVHQILHHASRLRKGVKAPFQRALLMSNAIVLPPKTPAELRPQFQALCRALYLDPASPSIISQLREVSADKICHVIETDAVGTEYGTYRGCVDDDWLAAVPDAMAWQRSGNLAQSLQDKGVKSVVIGDTIEEWYLYSIAHPVKAPADVVLNLERYYPDDIVRKMVKLYRTLPDDAGAEESARLYGEIASDYQVHLPVRLLARDLQAAGYPVLRYEFRWTPEQVRPKGYVTHGTDGVIWHLRVPSLEPAQVEVAKKWIESIDVEVEKLEAAGKPLKPVNQVLALCEDKSIKWIEDGTWDLKMRLLQHYLARLVFAMTRPGFVH
ncbi:alpha/beta-hydrolase [Hymenopellis radicata]|nr:alpha/beta-hydrolase [Hymenopellis radicata]